MIRHFVFDIGKVILKFDFGLTFARLAPHCSVPETDILETIKPILIQLETGTITTTEFAEAGMRLVGYSGYQDDYVRAFQDIFTLNEPVADLIEELDGAGKPLYLLSNTSEMHVSWFTHRYRVFDHFEGAIFSHEAGCMKPDPEIFRLAVSRFGFDPVETLYIDDLAANVAAAEAIGFRGLVYDHHDHADFRAGFDRLTGLSG